MNNYILKDGYLYHYGTKGQKWGRRNYQHEDGSYTDKGQQENQGHGRYASECEDFKSPKQLDRAKKSKYKITLKKDSNKDLVKKSDNKSLKLSEKQKKVLMGAAIGAGIALGVGTVFYLKANTNLKNFNPGTDDFTIPAGDMLQRISPDTDLRDVFYASYGDKDNKIYRNLLPAHYLMQGKNEINIMKLNLGSDLKIAGRDTCIKVYEDLAKKGDLDKEIFPGLGVKHLAYSDYDSFNQYIATHDDIYNKFFDELKKMGYNGLYDENDQHYSGYYTEKPLVIFNPSVVSDKTISTEKILNGKNIVNYLIQSEIVQAQMVLDNKGAGGAAIALGTSTVSGLIYGAGIGTMTSSSNKKQKQIKSGGN